MQDEKIVGQDPREGEVMNGRETRLLHIVRDNNELIDFALSLICQIELEQKKGQTPASLELTV